MTQNMPSTSPLIVRGQIESIAFGGKGVLRHEGLVIFVPFTCPGEEVEVEIIKKKKSYAEGRLLAVLKEADSRTSPHCPYYGTCGGCQLQHLDYPTQLEAKRQMVVDAFMRIGKLALPFSPDIVPAEPSWHYRRRIRWNLKEVQGRVQAGFISVDGSSLVENKVCPIFVDDTDTVLDYVRHAVSRLQGCPAQPSWVSIVKNGQDGFIVSFDFRGKRPKNMWQIAEGLLDHVEGVVIRCSKGVQHLGNTQGRINIDRMGFTFSPLSFVQAHPQQSAAIYEAIRDIGVQSNWERAIDLYCGIGITSVLLGKEGVYVRGIEINPDSVALARQNAKENQVVSTLFECGNVGRILPKWLKTAWDGMIVNPPRTGVDPETLSHIAQGAVKDLIYVSCMPATLARDCAELHKQGFALDSVRIFDMFPQTTHLETVVHLRRG